MTRTRNLPFTLTLTLFAIASTAWAIEYQPIENESQLISAAENALVGTQYDLDADITLTHCVTVKTGKWLRLNLNGKIINRGLSSGSASDDGCVFHVEEESVLELQNSGSSRGGITGGYATYGGGIYNEGGIFVHGGKIYGNKAQYKGGGIYNIGSISIDGGSISDNNAEEMGGGIWNGGTLYVHGSVQVSGNHRGTANNNIFLPDGKYITMTNILADDASIYVSTEKISAKVTSGYSQYPYSTELIKPDADRVMVKEEDEVYSYSYYIERFSDGTSAKRPLRPGEYSNFAVPESRVLASGVYFVDTLCRTILGTLVCSGVRSVSDRLTVPSGAEVKLVLADGVQLTLEKGINVAPSTNGESATEGKLRIYGQKNDTGKLIAKGEKYQAGVGGNEDNGNGLIEIHGGIVDATGGDYGAGIGTGDEAGQNGGNGYVTPISIYGGTVIAQGGLDGAGIGGGNESQVKVFIYGGTVNATGGSHAAGIGGGDDAGTFGVYIRGGTVEAHGGFQGAGIGGGFEGEHDVTVDISGGTVSAYGVQGGAGIGSGAEANNERDINVSITGGTVYAQGSYTASNSSVYYSTAIGAGTQGQKANVVITGGTVTANVPYPNGGDFFLHNGYCYKFHALGIPSNKDGGYSIAGNLLVEGGSNESNATKAEFANRGEKSKLNWVRISPCNHEGGLSYTVAEQSHTSHCKFCNHSATGDHHADNDGVCTICGYKVNAGVWSITLLKPDVDASGNFEERYSAVGPVSVLRGEGLLLSASNVQVKGYLFKGWEVSNVFGLAPTENAVLLQPGETYVPESNVNIWARYVESRTVTVLTAGSSEPNGSYTFYEDVVEDGAEYTLPVADYVPTGYEFVGWYVGSIEDLVQGGYAPAGGVQYDSETGKFSAGGQVLKNQGETLTVDDDVAVVAIYVKTDFGAVTIAADRSSATIDGNYTGTDVVDIPSNITVDTVIFDRAFASGFASTVVLPFSISTDKVEGANFYDITVVKKENGRWSSVGTHRLGKTEVETIEANKPYLVKLQDGKEKLIFHGEVTLNTSVKQPYTVNDDSWSFRGNYRTFHVGDTASLVGITYGFTTTAQDGYDKGVFAKGASDATILAMRCYLVYMGVSTPQGNSNQMARSALMTPTYTSSIPGTIDVEFDDGEEGTTVIGRLDTRTGEIHLAPRTADRWFDIQGRVLNGKPTIKGRYIHNGKLVIIK